MSPVSDEPLTDAYFMHTGSIPLLVSESEIFTIAGTSIAPLIPDVKAGPGDYFPTIDSDGNLWYWEKSDSDTAGATLVKYDQGSSEIILRTPMERQGYLLACDNGVYQVNGKILRFAENDTSYTILSPPEKWDLTCQIPKAGDMVLRKDGSFIYLPEDQPLNSNALEKITEYKDGSCSVLPFPDIAGSGLTWTEANDDITELHDGTLLYLRRYMDGIGIYVFDGSSWQLLEGTQGIVCSNPIKDKTGRIWATTNNSIVRQNDAGCELINDGNSNLPPFGSDNMYGNNFLLEDAAGTVWLYAAGDYFIAKTQDGYNWTVYDTVNSTVFSGLPHESMNKPTISGGPNVFGLSGPGERIIGMALNQDGVVEFDYFNPGNCADSECLEIIRCTDNGTSSWSTSVIPVPAAAPFDSVARLSVFPAFREKDGGYWILGHFPHNYALYHNPGGTSDWIAFESPENPYEITAYIGEYGGKTYFRDKSGDVVVYHPVQQTVDPNPVRHAGPVTAAVNNSVSARYLSNGMIMIEFSIPQTTSGVLSLISLNGKVVKQLEGGTIRAGTHRKTCGISAAPGIYLVRLQTPGAVQSAHVLIR